MGILCQVKDVIMPFIIIGGLGGTDGRILGLIPRENVVIDVYNTE